MRKIINFFRDYSFMLYEAEYKTKYGERYKILASKQMIQRLPIALAQVKAGNNSQNLFNDLLNYLFLVLIKRNY